MGFDEAMKKTADDYEGIYRRYSDDFILLISKDNTDKSISYRAFKELEMKVRDVSEGNKIEL